tara:strand:- start:52 stop:318 length:267 start_codon:yes stop_codon:yes gene_type:complete
MSIDSFSFCEDGFQARLIEGLLSNEPFLRHFLRHYLTSLNDNEMQMFFIEYINSYDGSLDSNKDFYKSNRLIKRSGNKLIPLRKRRKT